MQVFHVRHIAFTSLTISLTPLILPYSFYY